MFSYRISTFLALLTISLITLSKVNAYIPVPFSTCGSSKDLFQISNVSANAWPPQKGTDLVVLFDGTVLENVSDGRYEISVTWETVPVYDEKGDITKLLLNQTLPITNGTFCYLEKNVTLESEIPDGSYVVKVEAWDTNNNVFTCFEVKFSIGLKLPNTELLHTLEIPVPSTPKTLNNPHPHSNFKTVHGSRRLRRERGIKN